MLACHSPHIERDKGRGVRGKGETMEVGTYTMTIAQDKASMAFIVMGSNV